MKIIKINILNPQKSLIKKAVNVMKLGGVIVYPTDTCYGLGADITNEVALNKIYKIKSRDINRPMAMIVKDISQVTKFAEVNSKIKKLLAKYLPGQITFILLNTNFKNFKYNTIGIRIPNYKVTKMMSEYANFPYTTTSANISGKNICYYVKEVISQFKNQKIKPDLILDGGQLPVNKPSTVVDLTTWPPKIIRKGPVKIKIK